MASPPPATGRTRACRGRVATHDAETLLDLVSAVARAAVTTGAASLATRVTMAAFNVVRLDVDRVRGIADPRTSPERTPTADAIQMRFRELGGRAVPWLEVVEVALRPPRTARCGCPRCAEAMRATTSPMRWWLTPFSAWRTSAAFALSPRTSTPIRSGSSSLATVLGTDDGLMESLLRTANQILTYCHLSWPAALKLAGFTPRRQPGTGVRRPAMNPVPGLPVAQVVAFYAALNGTWPSYPALRHFAASCNIRMRDTQPGGMGPVRAEAADLLTAAGVASPGGTRGGGKARRLTYRYPVGGIPGAPLRDPVKSRGVALPGKRYDELRRQLAVMSVRVWLAGLDSGARRVRAHYVRWQVGSVWTPASSFEKWGCGGFSSQRRPAPRMRASAKPGETRLPTRSPKPRSSVPRSRPSRSPTPLSSPSPSRSRKR